MIVESFDVGGNNPQKFGATRLVVKDDHGNPICVVVEYLTNPDGGQVHYVLRPTDPEFENVLAHLGIGAAKVAKVIKIG